jgi:hypothetical protein
MPPPQRRTIAKTLCILCQPTSPDSSSAVRAVWEEARKAGQMSMLKAKVVTMANRATVTVAARIVRAAPSSSHSRSAVGTAERNSARMAAR